MLTGHRLLHFAPITAHTSHESQTLFPKNRKLRELVLIRGENSAEENEDEMKNTPRALFFKWRTRTFITFPAENKTNQNLESLTAPSLFHDCVSEYVPSKKAVSQLSAITKICSHMRNHHCERDRFRLAPLLSVILCLKMTAV